MARYLITFTGTYEVEADNPREALAVAEELTALSDPDTEAVTVEILKGIAD